MEKRSVHLTKNGHEYVFRYSPGYEGGIVDEIIRLVEDSATDLDWMDAATLGFWVSQQTAVECCKEIMSPVEIKLNSNDDIDQANSTSSGSDDAKDGPCTSTSYP